MQTTAGRGPSPRATQHIRGSSLLLAGRTVSLGLDFATQVLLVRYLSKDAFGAWSYALAVVALFGNIALFEMGNTLARFVPLYRERNDVGRVRGAIALAFAVVLTLGSAIAIGIIVTIVVIGIRPTEDPSALQLVVLVSFLIPVQGLDSLLTSLFASLGASRPIFLRQAVIGPTLRLVVVLALILSHSDVLVLAIGYVGASILGLLLYGGMLRGGKLWRSDTDAPSDGRLIPAREMLGFATPLLTSTLVWLLMESSDALLLGFFFDSAAVANFRAVLPMARLNQIVTLTFATLYLPTAARLYARGAYDALADTYWQTAAWMCAFTFPILLITFSFAPSATVGLYGIRYASSAPIMAVLAIGYFFQTALGFNGLTLKVYGKLRYTVSIDVAMALLNVIANLVLIPRYGPIGAAIGTSATLVLHNVLKQFGLWRYTGWPALPWQYAPVYAAIIGLAVLAFILESLWSVGLPLAIAISSILGIALFAMSRRLLEWDQMFPELGAIPILGTLFQAREP